MRAVCADFETKLVEFNGKTDHVHLLVHYPPKVSLSRLVGSLKGVCARRLPQELPRHIHKHLWGEHFWPPSYFAASCGGGRPAVDHQGIHRQPETSQLRPTVQTPGNPRLKAVQRSASSRAGTPRVPR
ncbi:IS200/IS605 family transposase [Streptomyces sp. NPDC056910]|uniref:IS200/IS605 family transposase n=1 Tax=Streptomyces sp. NPDC056910 TaxID=3345964 RepID=UPI003691D267